ACPSPGPAAPRPPGNQRRTSCVSLPSPLLKGDVSTVRGEAHMLAGPGLLAAALSVAGPAAASPRAVHAAPRAPHDIRFIQTSTRSNVVENSTYINNQATNGHRHILIFVTPSFNPNNTAGGRFNNHPIGVWYDTSVNKWAIFNE